MAEEKKSGRTYHVLKRIAAYAEDGESELEVWDEIGTVEASGPTQAIRLAAAEDGSGRYCAVPDGNWTEIGVRVEIPAPRVILDSDDDAPAPPAPTAEVGDEVSAVSAAITAGEEIDRAAEQHSVAVGEQEMSDGMPPLTLSDDPVDDGHGPSEATRAELRRQAAEREAQKA